MEKNIYMQEFDCFNFFKNIIQSKYSEAQRHLKKLELAKTHAQFFSMGSLDEIKNIHEEQSDFISIAYKQCKIWRGQSLLSGQFGKINNLEEVIKKLETTIYHILFIIEQTQRKKNAPNNEESTDDLAMNA